jgi:hypothetical protein
VRPKKDMMNCEDYREALTTDPGFADESGHVESCASCQAYATELLAFNDRIAAAMDLRVPELLMPELPGIDVENVVPMRARRPASTPAWFALAATVVLATFVGVRMTGLNSDYGTLEEQVLAHLDHEPFALRVSNTMVSDARLLRAVPADVATMNHDAGLITYAQSCIINGKTVPHLVVQGKYGPVTILLMPDERVSSARDLDGENIRGVILPVGDGSIAIIGTRDEQIEQVKQNVLDSVMWST